MRSAVVAAFVFWVAASSQRILAQTGYSDEHGAANPLVIPVAQNDSRVEDIYITRNIRVSRTAPTNFCAGAGFTAQFEEVYEYHAAATDRSGSMTSTDPKVLGQLRACLVTSGPASALLYGKGTLNGVTFTTRGPCVFRRDSPVSGFIVARCSEELEDLPPPYVGGQLVTNALSSSTPVGPDSSPPGYVQSGVSIFRLWRGAKLSSIAVPQDELSAFVGTYDVGTRSAGGILRVGTDRPILVTLVGEQLMIQRPGDKTRTPLMRVTANHFVQVGSGADIEFIRGPDGAALELVFRIAEYEGWAVRRGIP
jgi:hypothetical protein